MITEAQIRGRLASYLAGGESLDSFEDWLVEHSWNMHHDSSESAQELVNAIELRLSEYSSDNLSDDMFRRELHQFLENLSIVVEEYEEYEIVRKTSRKRVTYLSRVPTIRLEALFQEALA